MDRETMLGRLVSALKSVPTPMFGTLVDLVRKLSGKNGDQTHLMLRKMLRGELVVAETERVWREQDGVIYFSVTSDNESGEGWIPRLEGKGFRMSDYAKSVLRSSDFKPTDGVTTEIAVLKGMLFSDGDRITKKIRAEADKRKLTKPNTEVACLIREKFSDEELKSMGLWWIVTMHEPIKDSRGSQVLLGVGRLVDWWLGTYAGRPGSWWDREDGFAFAVSPK